MSSEKLAQAIAELAAEKKADDIVILDMREIVNYCDYFVLCTGNTDRQVKAIANGIDDGLAEKGLKVRFKQGMEASKSKGLGNNPLDNHGMWVLMDVGDVVAHIFEPDAREFYGLEHLWQEAKTIHFQDK